MRHCHWATLNQYQHSYKRIHSGGKVNPTCCKLNICVSLVTKQKGVGSHVTRQAIQRKLRENTSGYWNKWGSCWGAGFSVLFSSDLKSVGKQKTKLNNGESHQTKKLLSNETARRNLQDGRHHLQCVHQCRLRKTSPTKWTSIQAKEDITYKVYINLG